MSKATMTVEGFVANEPRLNHTQTGKAVISITVPHQRSKKLDGGGYENTGETTWAEAVFWEDQAELIAEQVTKGTAVIVTGDPEMQIYDKRDGGQGAKVILRFPTLGIVPRATRSQGQGGRGAAGSTSAGDWDSRPAPTPQTGAQDVWAPAGGYNDETPF